MTVPLTNRLAFGQKQGNELIEVLQEIRDELRDLNAGQDLATSSEIRAVAINHGIKDAFSTGSQNHHPPQPNS